MNNVADYIGWENKGGVIGWGLLVRLLGEGGGVVLSNEVPEDYGGDLSDTKGFMFA